MNYTPLRRYYRGDELVAVRDVPAGTTRYYHFDHQGTTQALTDSTGAVTDRFASDAWGVEVKRTGSSINRHWYVGASGYYRQVDNTLDYIRARWYRPATAAWRSRDPMPQQAAYAYVANQPSVDIDPSGYLRLAPSCTASPLGARLAAAIDCICKGIVGTTVTHPKHNCCWPWWIERITYSSFLDVCPHPPIPEPKKDCCRGYFTYNDWCKRERNRRITNQALYNRLKNMCKPSSGPTIRCRNCRKPEDCARTDFGGMGDMHICVNNILSGSCPSCLTGYVFHEMGHVLGFGIIGDFDWQEPFNCFESYPCNGMTYDDASKRGIIVNTLGPCAKI